MKKTKVPGLIPVLILTLITVVMWVSLDVYRTVKKPEQSVVSDEVTKSLTPKLDQEAMEAIESRIILDDSQIPDIVANSSPTPKPAVTPKAVATPKPSTMSTESPTDSTPVPETTL